MSNAVRVTTQCSAFAHPDFVVSCDDTIPQGDIKLLTSFLEQSVQAGTRFIEGDLITFGSMLFRVARSEDFLTLEEPDLESFPIEWIQGVTRSMQLMRQQRDIADSVGLGDEIDPPSIRSSLLVGADLESYDEDVLLERLDSVASDSGWFVGRRNTVLNYEDNGTMRRISIYQAILNWPRIGGFLGLPAGCRIEITAGKPLFTRNGKTLRIKQGSLIDALTRTRRQ